MTRTKKARKKYIEILRKMSPEERLKKCFELSKFSKDLFLAGLKNSFQELTESKIKEKYLKQIAKCRNLKY